MTEARRISLGPTTKQQEAAHERLMARTKKAPEPYVIRRIGILNHLGGIWTPETFDSTVAARKYIADYVARNPAADLSKHEPVHVEVTVRVVEAS